MFLSSVENENDAIASSQQSRTGGRVIGLTKPYPVTEFVDDLVAWLADADKGINSPKLTDAQKIQFVRDIHNRCRGLLREFILSEMKERPHEFYKAKNTAF